MSNETQVQPWWQGLASSGQGGGAVVAAFVIAMLALVTDRWLGILALDALPASGREVPGALAAAVSELRLQTLWRGAALMVLLLVLGAWLARLGVERMVRVTEAVVPLAEGRIQEPASPQPEQDPLLAAVAHTRVRVSALLRLADECCRQLSQSALQIAEITHPDRQAVQVPEACVPPQSEPRISGEVGDTQAPEADDALNRATDRIWGLIGNTRAMADETRLLAMNVVMESGRAGEAGREFAELAHDIRTLAEQSRRSSDEVDAIVAQIAANAGIARPAAAGSAGSPVNERQPDGPRSGLGLGLGPRSEEIARQDNLLNALHDREARLETVGAIGLRLEQAARSLAEAIARFDFEAGWPAVPRAEEEQRAVPRAPNSLLVTVELAERQLEGVTADFALSGASLVLPAALPVGGQVRLAIRLPHDNPETFRTQAPLRLQARVVWSRPGAGGNQLHGVSFDALDDEQRGKLRVCLQFFRRHALYSKA